MYGSILVAVDGSEANKLAVDTAINLAKTQNASLTAMCVFDMGSYSVMSYSISDDKPLIDEMANNALAYARQEAEKAGIKLETKIAIGRPADSIVKEAEAHDLVVCGTHGRTGFSHALIGSVAERIVRYSPCPVLIIRNPSEPQ